MTGDPHVKVKVPGQDPVCFDIHTDKPDTLISLLKDENNGIAINGQLKTDRKHKNRLSTIILNTAGSSLEIHPRIIFIQGEVYDYSKDQEPGAILTVHTNICLMFLEGNISQGIKSRECNLHYASN